MLALHGQALVFGQQEQGRGKAEHVLMAHRPSTRRRFLSRQAFEPKRRTIKLDLQRALARNVSLAALELTTRVGKGVNEHLPQPGCQFGFALSPKLFALAMRFEQSLLDQVRGIELALQLLPEVHAGKKNEVRAVLFKVQVRGLG